jgi:AraC-like DNA-binding protein
MGAATPGRSTAETCPGGSARSRVLLSAFRGLPDLLEKFRVPAAAVLRQYGLTKAHLDESDRTGSFTDMSRLLAHSAAATNCPHFGLLLGRTVNLRSLGVVGRLARHASTVETALDGLVTYFAMHDTGATLDVRVESEAATFSYTIHATAVAALEQVYDFSMAAMASVMNELCGAGRRPTLVMLRRQLPREPRPYHEIFRAPLQFDALQAAIVFPRRWLALPVPTADPILYRLLLREVRAGVEETEPLVCRDVRRSIIQLLHEQHCSRSEVAHMLGLHERTLCRRLHSCGTTFQDLLDETRSMMAQQLLRDTHVPISRIARELGFSDSTVMARAFRRWNGMSPREYRNGLRQAH